MHRRPVALRRFRWMLSIAAASFALAPGAASAAPPDTTPPVTTDNVPADWVRGAPDVELTRTDAGGSGVATTYYETGWDPTAPTIFSPVYNPNNFPSLQDGQRIRYFSVDVAGNAEAVKTSAVAKVDDIPPTITDDVPAGWVAAPPSVTLTATDTADSGAGSGIGSIHYEISPGFAVATSRSPVYDPAHKPTLHDDEKIYYIAIDAVGNAGSGRSVAAQVDTSPPTTTDNVPTGWVAVAPRVSLYPTDNHQSGVATTYYELGTDPAAPTTASPVYDPADRPRLNDGERIRYLSVDAVGNTEAATTSAAAKVDTTGPTTNDDVTAATPPGQPVTLTANDGAGSGVGAIYYETGRVPAMPTTASAVYDPAHRPVLAAGERIRYFSVDAVGNRDVLHFSLVVPTPAPVPPPIETTPTTPTPVPPLAPLRLTKATTSRGCVGTGPRASRDVEVRYTLSAAASVTITLERRVWPVVKRAPRCPAKLPGASDSTTANGEPVVYVVATAKRTGRTKKQPLRVTKTAQAGRNRLKLLRALKVKSLPPGRYRLRIVPARPDGTAGNVVVIPLWVLG